MEMELRADWATPWMVWFGLYSSTSSHFLSSVCKSLNVCVCVCVCVCVFVCMRVHNISTCVHMCFYIRVWIPDCGSWKEHSATFIFGFSLASSMSCSAVLASAPAHTLASARDSEQMFPHSMKAMLLYLNPSSCPAFFEHSPKTSARALPFEKCSLINKTYNATHVFLPLFSLFFFLSFPFLSLLLTVWNTTLCEFRKSHRYPPFPPIFFVIHLYG